MTKRADDVLWLFRPGSTGAAEIRRDVLALTVLALLLYAAGLGLRDPWPADEPRFALIARDMVSTGQWLFPQVGGDWYQDKPPVFFWAIAAFYALTGNLAVAFLLPSLLAGIGSLLLVYDLGRRVWSREVGLAAAGLLAVSFQMVVQARAAQIDMLLTLFATAGLYGIGRHLLAGPDWRAYTLGGFAAGVGVITKGTGFLPLLLLLPFAALRRGGFLPRAPARGGARWWLAPAALLAGISLWLVPMLIAVELSGDPGLRAYRDEILFRQTVTRYAAAWGHHEPWYYFILEVIPLFWLPGTALLPWLVPRWREAWRQHDGRSLLFLGWVVLVVGFFSLSTGKRGVYVLPALPAFALAAGPYLVQVWQRRGVQRTAFGLAALLGLAAAAASLYLGWIRPDRMAELAERHDVASIAPLVTIAAAVALCLALLRPRRGLLAWIATVACIVFVQGFWINPMINDARSGRAFVEAFERASPPGGELGLTQYREQYLLYITRPVVNFGHRRDDPEQEAFDAARWLSERSGRTLLVDEELRGRCFGQAAAEWVGHSNRRDWFLVRDGANPACAAQGDPGAALLYLPDAR